MAQTITYSYNNPVAGPKIQMVGLLPITIALAADTYATASGGITVDLSTQFTANQIAHSNVFVYFSGFTAAGHRADFTKSATSGQFTMRLWNGTTEISDGSVTQTVQVNVPYSPGAAS